MKSRTILLAFILVTALLTGCAQPSPAPAPPQQSPSPEPTPSDATPDAVTTASIVADAEALEKAMSSNGTWIICLTKDISTDKELVLDGEFKNGKKDEAGKDIIQRKLALYAQDENRKVTARYTLTAPRITINSPEASIQRGTFKGDIYVNAKNFKLVDATIDGNVFFTNDDAKNTFSMDETSKITGKQEKI